MWSIVVAGGSGRRFGGAKQFTSLRGRPVLAWAVDACRGVSDGVVLVIPAEVDADASTYPKADAVVAGGATRTDSVRLGLAAVPAEADIVVVHDAARPLAPPALFAAVLSALREDGVDGAVPGLAPSDTIKVVDEAMNVTSTLDRTALVAVQTPQAFRAAALRAAHARVGTGRGGAATDDAMLVETSGGRVRVVPGHADNLKITTPDDLARAERLLEGRQA
ncbi:MAG TPA: 2-C-methyl-D-erythritol 4-phosphate cytidylyltransferase [Acidimicrobiales bacterium]|nr:2-C-methyl-D-erythritol 4-phosphate cytidylyltransferase [Acidimicrobiales bacterium]